jgi:phosphatidylglycerol:prolipoprotein diacylglycerol transferase
MTELFAALSVYLTQAALKFPEWSPALISIDFGFIGLGEFHLRWYALGYIGGSAGAWWYGSQLLKRPALWKSEPPLTQDGLDDLMFWIIIGIILGGRLGYILFYMVPYQMDVLAADPLTIIRIWDGGMAFHGGILGVALVLWFFAAKRGVPLLSVGDIAGVTAPIGIGLVRILPMRSCMAGQRTRLWGWFSRKGMCRARHRPPMTGTLANGSMRAMKWPAIPASSTNPCLKAGFP